MKKTVSALLLATILLSLSGFVNPVWSNPAGAIDSTTFPITYGAGDKIAEKIQQRAMAARQFAHQKKFNEKYCFLIDMSMPSGQARFFIYDLVNDNILGSGLVAHGGGYGFTFEGKKYSNEVGSGYTSLGRYRIGAPYYGNFGYSYKLHGLDSSNSNAYERTVVLHAHSAVPDKEVEGEICNSLGCPMVSPGFLLQLKEIINHSGKPVLLWIFE